MAPISGGSPGNTEPRIAFIPPPESVFLIEGGIQPTQGGFVLQYENPNCTGRAYTYGATGRQYVIRLAGAAYRADLNASTTSRWSMWNRGWPNDCESLTVPRTEPAYELIPAALPADWDTPGWQLDFGVPP